MPPALQLESCSAPPAAPALGCPICGGTERVALFEEPNRYLLCRPCGLAMAPELPDARRLEERAEYWAKKHNLRPDRTDLVYRQSHQEAAYGPIRRLLEATSARGRLLEVGCAAGGFLDTMRKHGWQVAGIELARSSVDFARERGLDVRAGTIEDLPLDERGSHDAVVALDVIEHLADPIGFLRHCTGALRPGGTLLILTPNLAGISARCLGGAWEAACPRDHLWLFTPRALRRAIAMAGASVHRLQTWDVSVPLLRRLRPARAAGAASAQAGGDGRERSRRLALTERIGRSRLLRCLRGGANALLTTLSVGDKLVVVATKPRLDQPGS